MLINNILYHTGRQRAADIRRSLTRTQGHGSFLNFCRRASTTAGPVSVEQYHIPKRLVHIAVPILTAVYCILRFTDPALAPQPALKSTESAQATCTKVHARDLDRYIKANLDGISDEHTVAWNRMYNNFKEDRKNEGHLERTEKENARQLAEYARMEENKSRSTKVEGVMATLGGNTNISHRPESVEEIVKEKTQTFQGNLVARWAEFKRKLTKVTKGHLLF